MAEKKELPKYIQRTTSGPANEIYKRQAAQGLGKPRLRDRIDQSLAAGVASGMSLEDIIKARQDDAQFFVWAEGPSEPEKKRKVRYVAGFTTDINATRFLQLCRESPQLHDVHFRMIAEDPGDDYKAESTDTHLWTRVVENL